MVSHHLAVDEPKSKDRTEDSRGFLLPRHSKMDASGEGTGHSRNGTQPTQGPGCWKDLRVGQKFPQQSEDTEDRALLALGSEACWTNREQLCMLTPASLSGPRGRKQELMQAQAWHRAQVSHRGTLSMGSRHNHPGSPGGRIRFSGEVPLWRRAQGTGQIPTRQPPCLPEHLIFRGFAHMAGWQILLPFSS